MSNQNNIYSQGTEKTSGVDAQRMNFYAARLVGEAVRSTLGPKGMDKMLVDSFGNVIVTNDGVTILKEMDIEHPTAKMVVDIAKTQENEVGDGTTTAVILAAELIRAAENLIDSKIHPTVISQGYKLALDKVKSILNDLAISISSDDTDILKSIVKTAMTGKGTEGSKDIFSDILIDVVKSVYDGVNFDFDNIKIEKKVGGSIEDSKVVDGIILDKERVNSSMPLKVENAKVLLLGVPLEVKSGEFDAKISIDDPSKMQAFLDMEESMLKDQFEKIRATGANVVLCQKGIDDLIQYYMAKEGIFAVRRVKKSDMGKLSKALGVDVINNLKDLSESVVANVGCVEEVKFNEDGMIFVSGIDSAKAVSILLRGGSEHILDETKRAVDDALGDLRSALKSSKVLGGAGAVEMELAKRLSNYADTLNGRIQLAVKAFSKVFEVIPKVLAENAGLDPINVITDLKSSHASGNIWSGIDVFSGKICNSIDVGVIEPFNVKYQAIISAVEVAMMIVRIDDVIVVKKKEVSNNKPDFDSM